jgi:hypothetical protein
VKRREFVVAGASLAGLMVSPLARAQIKPCPPGTANVAGGSSVTASCVANADAAGLPAYMSGMASLEVRNLTGKYAPSNGMATMWDALPPAWRLTGQPNGADGVFASWCGGKGDAASRKLFVHGGGHGDSSNNGLYVYDFSGDAAPAGWSVAPSSLTSTPPAITPYEPTGGVYPDGRPAAIHSYDQQWYDPTQNRWYRYSGSPFSNNGGTGAYAFYYDFNRQAWSQWGPQIASGQGSLGGILIGAPDGSKFLSISGNSGARFITPAGSTTYAGTPLWAFDDDANHTTAYDSVNGRWFTCGYASGLGGQACWTFQVNWSAGTISNVTVRRVTFPEGVEAASIVFDAEHSRGPCFWVFGYANAMVGRSTMGTTIYRVDASTFAVTSYILTGDPIVLANSSNMAGSYNRHVWFPNWRIVATVHAHNAPASLIKLPNA